MRVAIAGFHHETNTFAAKGATYEDFEKADSWPALCKGAAILESLQQGNIPAVGFLDTAKSYGWHIEPLIWCNAPPAGRVEKDAYERIVREIIFGLQAVKGRIDAIYLDMHGAMAAENTDDGEGELLHRIRRIMGADIPIVMSLDFHANVTREMFELADVLVGFYTYPHVDMYDTGVRAAKVLYEVLSRFEKPYKSMAKLPFLVPITSQCTLIEPAKSLYKLVEACENEKEATSASMLMGFPPADIAECGPAIIAYAWKYEKSIAMRDKIEKAALESEKLFSSKLWAPDEAVSYAKAHYAGKPIILADTQDNPGAGASSDTVGILRALLNANAQGAVIACHYDPENAGLAKRCGEKKDLFISLGGHISGDEPLEGVFTVEKITDKPFFAAGPYFGGCMVDLGTMVLVRHKGVRVILVSKRVQPADRAVFTHIGINPQEQRILVLKSSVHFRADFQEIADKVLVVEAKGLNIENPEQLPYQYLRKNVRLKPMGKERQ